ncbi:MAG: hypothetical protein KC486_01255 [Myxococcales bacterium]|nr:hypothetical protein [Myxococcales bacterium]
MGPCEISIELEEPSRRYSPGESIRGVVRVRVRRDTACNALSLRPKWRCSAQGSASRGDHRPELLFSGDWRPGVHIYDFALVCHAWPISFHGDLFDVDWVLEAYAEIDWHDDAVESVPILVEPAADAVIDVSSISATPPDTSPSLTLGALGASVAGLIVLVEAVTANGPFPVIACGAAASLVGAYFLWEALATWLARQAFERLNPRIVAIEGRQLLIDVDYETPFALVSVEPVLVVEERVLRVTASRADTGEQTIKTDVRERSRTSGDRVSVRDGGPDTLRLALALPDPREVGCSLTIGEMSVNWRLELIFRFARWPAHVASYDLEVAMTSWRTQRSRSVPTREAPRGRTTDRLPRPRLAADEPTLERRAKAIGVDRRRHAPPRALSSSRRDHPDVP